MKSNNYTYYITVICLLSSIHIFSQKTADSLVVSINELNLVDTLPKISNDTSKTKGVKISKDAITRTIKYSALDSNFTDVTNKEVKLYHGAIINVDKTELTSDYVIFNFDNNLAKAYDKIDTAWKVKTKPIFKDGETQGQFSEIQYNFKSKKGLVKQLSTTQSEFFIIGEKSKFIGKDSVNLEDKVFQQNAIISTCDHNPPHFGIRAWKMKMIPQEIAIMGPAQLEIAGIPTPIVLPFGFFPLIKGRSSGLIFPRDYTFDKELGFGLQGIGYYFPINDYLDGKITTSIWTRGTHSVNLGTNYRKRYQYSGNMELSYANSIREDGDGKPNSQKSFGITLSHNQDSKAHPYRTLGGSINIQTNRNTQRTNYDYASQINNKLTSNFNYTYRWPEKPYSFRASLSHSQDNNTRQMNITLPDASFNLNTIQPFKKKNSSGDPSWYENINFDYNAGLKNFVKATDTTLFTAATLRNLETGFKQSANVSFNARVLKYFTISPSASMDDVYFLKTLQKHFDPTTIVDSSGGISTEPRVRYGTVRDTLQTDLSAFRAFRAAISINTALFATKRFSKGWLRGVRHTVKPTVSIGYTPQTQQKYERYVDTDTRPDQNIPFSYNPFATGAFAQSLNTEAFSLNYSLNNIFEMKYRGKKDSIDKKVNIFDNLVVSGFYNFAADSFKWSDVFISANAELIKNYSRINMSASLSPYEMDFTTRRKKNNLLINSDKKALLQLMNFNVGVNSNITFKQLKELFAGKKPEQTGQQTVQQRRASENKISFVDVFERMAINHNLSFDIVKSPTGRDSFVMGANSILLTGGIPLTKNWDLTVGSISYDFKAKQLVYPSFALSRDLHCWTMRFSWVPQVGVYSFFIGVKQGAFNFLKYDYNQPYRPPR